MDINIFNPRSLCSILILIFTSIRFSSAQTLPNFDYVPSKAIKGQSEARFISSLNAFDAPYLKSVNSSVFEWWWFEAFAEDLKTSLTIIFFTTSGNAFPLSGNTNSEVTSVFISGLLPNGTVFYDSLPATGAVFVSAGPLGESTAAEFLSSGAKFTGTPDLSEYVVQIKSPAIQGELHLASRTPAHYPCSSNIKRRQNVEVFPRIGWSNAQPAATARGTFHIGDQLLSFKNAHGYHDHNWGDSPFTTLIRSWYWGHATLGPYDLVWFDGIGRDGKEYVSGYLAQNGKILVSGCKLGGLKVRPKGGNATYPPHPGPDHKFDYLQITLDLADGKKFCAKAIPKSQNIRAPPLYTRWLGRISGGITGQRVYNGVGAFEEFTIN